jgi:hypothetical protein
VKFCPHCGTRLPEGARFCENCGTAVAAAPTEGAVPPVPPAPEPAAWAPAAGTFAQPAPSAAPSSAAPSSGGPVRPGARRAGSRRGLLTGLGGVAAVGVLGVAGYLVFDRLTGPGGGADSPQAAVLELSTAANAEDAVTALSLLPPREVGPLVALYEDVQAKATSTGVATTDAPLAGFDVRLDDVAVQVEELGEDVAAVTVTSGTVSWAVDPDQMQGALRIGSDGDVRRATDGSADLVEISREATDGEPLRIMTVRDDGSWYVSPMYTLLEAWRVDQQLPEPDFAQEVDLEGTGAGSAAAVVEEAAEAVAVFDADALLDLLSPEEAAALYQYRDAITTALHRDGALAELQAEGQLMIDPVDVVEGEAVDGRVPVSVRSASGVLTDHQEYVSWSLDGNCLSWVENGDADGACLEDVLADEGIDPGLADRFESVTLLTQEIDGRWYLSPLATLVAEARDAVAGMDADAVAAVLGVPQFGDVDGELEEGATTEGETAGWHAPALYEVDVPAGEVLSACVDGQADAFVYGPDGRPAGADAVLASDGGRYRVLVAGEDDGEVSFQVTPTLSSVEKVSVPATVPASPGEGCGWRMLSFEATAGETVLLDAGEGEAVQVRTPDGERVWETAFTPEESGTHHVTVPADVDVSIEPLGDEVLRPGGSTELRLAPGQEQSVLVFVDDGEYAGIEVMAYGTGVPYVELRSLDGTLVGSDYGTSYYGYAAVEPYAYEAAVYELVVANDSASEDTFGITVSGY